MRIEETTVVELPFLKGRDSSEHWMWIYFEEELPTSQMKTTEIIKCYNVEEFKKTCIKIQSISNKKYVLL